MTKVDQQLIKQQLSVYFIMGTANTSRHPLDVVKEAIQGGITMFQFREKGEGALQGEEKKKSLIRFKHFAKKRIFPLS